MMALIKKLSSDSFIRHSAVFFVGSISVAALNYLYHPILSRMMEVERFGEVQLLLSFVAQIGVLAGVFGIIVLNIFTNRESGDTEKTEVVGTLHTLAFTLMLLVSFSIALASPWLKSVFKFQSVWPFVILSLSFLLTIPFVFRQKYLQAGHQFLTVSIGEGIAAFFKLALAVIFIFIGFSTLGAIGGVALATVLSFWYARTHTSELHLPLLHPITPRALLQKKVRKELGFGLLVFATTSLITFLSTADIVFIKYFFTPQEAGTYSGVSTVARIIFFATASIAGVLMAHIKLKNAPADNARILFKGLGLSAFVGGTGVLIFSLVPSTIVSIFVGNQYEPFAFLLPKLSLVLFAVSMMQLLFMFFLSLRKKFIVPIAFIGILLVFGLTWVNHATPTDIVNNFLIASVVTASLLGGAVLLYVRSQHDQQSLTTRTETVT